MNTQLSCKLTDRRSYYDFYSVVLVISGAAQMLMRGAQQWIQARNNEKRFSRQLNDDSKIMQMCLLLVANMISTYILAVL